MNKRKNDELREIQFIKEWLNGKVELSEIDEFLETEGEEALRELVGFTSFGIGVDKKDGKYVFDVEVMDKQFGVTESEVTNYVENMRKDGWEFGTTKELIEDVIFFCPKCKKEVKIEVEDLIEKDYYCPKCNSKLEKEFVYEKVELEGSKTVEISKKEVEKLIKESSSVKEFFENLFIKLGLI